jgi:glyoxylase-like metal-dependent hydrolase (beta-lactamase superfamily II)
MIQINRFIFNPFQENTYVIFDETKECVIVDAGCYTSEEKAELEEFVSSNGLKPKFAVNTHGHIDHILGNKFVKDTWGVELLGNPEDIPLVQSAVNQAIMFGLSIDDVPIFDKYLNHGDSLRFGNSEIKIIGTPGHSQGGICLYSAEGNFLLAGDTLFKESIGRTDLPGGDYKQLLQSINLNLLTLPENVVVYSGHGDPSTIGWENNNNPFLTQQ